MNQPLKINTGKNPALTPMDIGHDKFIALINPATAFWSLVEKQELGGLLENGEFANAFRREQQAMEAEMDTLRFRLTPSAVYFNPTDRCNLDCSYCYIPADMRKNGAQMSEEKLCEALTILKDYFSARPLNGRKPQIVFHGAEPMVNRDAVFVGITRFRDDFTFGIQTNATLLDDEAIEFLVGNQVAVGVSLDGADDAAADANRRTWDGKGVSGQVRKVIGKMAGNKYFSVICTITNGNLDQLTEYVEQLHALGIGNCMLNIVRCTMPGARKVAAAEDKAAKSFIAALERTSELYRETGRKLVVANFANVILALVAPSARRLMCDISPCGGGRCFFAVSATGDTFPCSEFVGLPEYKGGNMFTDSIEDILVSPAFAKVTGRNIDSFVPCSTCAIKHFCGSPCPAEASAMNDGRIESPGAFCEFYEEQVRYIFRLIADGRHEDFLWDGWDKDMRTMFDFAAG